MQKVMRDKLDEDLFKLCFSLTQANSAVLSDPRDREALQRCKQLFQVSNQVAAQAFIRVAQQKSAK